MGVEYAIEFNNITKDFGSLRANDNISFKVKKGSIHALIGENGAGKSTLTSILFGIYEPTEGTIKINGKNIIVKNPNQANDLGIGMVHQHFKLVDVYSNIQNVILGSEIKDLKTGLLDMKIASIKIKAIQDLYNLHFDLKQKTSKASVGTQQKIEIMKMLYRDANILIFDEPTAVLTDQEIQGLLKTMKVFRENGKTIIFISHKLNEIKEVADYATVLRKGKVIGTYDVATTSTEQMAEAMVGKKVVMPMNETNLDDYSKVKPLLKFNNVSVKGTKQLIDASFEVRPGEILAFAGIEGNGQEELEQTIYGLLKPKKGKIEALIYDKKTKQNNIVNITNWNINKKNLRAGINVVPGDRHKYGLVLDFNIKDNSILRSLNNKKYINVGFINIKEKNKLYKNIEKNYDVRGTNKGFSLARSLSGGNQQKAIVGREMLTNHNILLVVQPTRGLDVGAIKLIHSKIIEEKKAGKAIILISYELDEVLALADTIAVINGGKILSIKPAKEYSRSEIGMMMAESVASKKEEKELTFKEKFKNFFVKNKLFCKFIKKKGGNNETNKKEK